MPTVLVNYHSTVFADKIIFQTSIGEPCVIYAVGPSFFDEVKCVLFAPGTEPVTLSELYRRAQANSHDVIGSAWELTYQVDRCSPGGGGLMIPSSDAELMLKKVSVLRCICQQIPTM